jgi:phage-related protein
MAVTIALPLPEKIGRDATLEISSRTLTAQFGDGYNQRAPDGLNTEVETWTVTWLALTLSERETVLAALKTVGGWGVLLWTPCYQTAQQKYKVKDGKRSVKVLSNSEFNISCTLEQVFDL